MSADPITVFYSHFGRYPGNNKQWWIARAGVDDPDATPPIVSGDFLPALLDKLYAGNMRSPRGHYVLDAFNKDREFVSGITGLETEVVKERPTSVAFFAGRVWYACNSTVYFSQLMTDRSRAGLCYQEADPTSEQISDPVATDGGVIPIPEANKIIKILPNAGGIVVFALNGVWFITGSNSGFSALDISVNKVSPIGCRAPQSVVETDKAVYYHSDVGIVGMQQAMGAFGPVPGGFDKTNISEETVQTLYNDIPDALRTEIKGVFDPKANVVYWLYRDTDVETNSFNRVLAFDLSLEAFYPWKFSNLEEDSPKVKGLYIAERMNSYTIPTDIDPSQIEYVTSANDNVWIAQVRNGNFSDWQQAGGGEGAEYDSYIEAGDELFDDAMRDKNITYIFSYFSRTEQEADEDGNPDYPSSCFLRIKWDWSNGSHSNKWTTPVQVYRPGRLLFDPDTGFQLAVTKNKVRGNGKAIRFRYGTSEIGRNFDLHGWSIAVTGNTTP